MLPATITMSVRTLLFAFITVACGHDRILHSELNPGCLTCTARDTLVYTKAVGPSDAIHQIWDFTRGAPTVIFAMGTVNSTLNITWNGAVPKKFEFSEEPGYSFAATLDQIYEYNDLEDSGYIDERSPQKGYALSNMRWRRTTIMDEQQALLDVHGYFRRGTLEVKLNLLPFKDYSTQLPHLIHTANSTLIDISLVNLTTSREFNASRYAAHFTLASTDSVNDTNHYVMRKSLDDEHTPGVFEIMEIKTPASYRSGAGGFIQFRPVAYTQKNRGVTTSTLARMSNFNRTELPHSSTLEAFYRDSDRNNLLVQDMFVSFGEGGDGYYKQHNYTAWSFSMGYGNPPYETFSPFVIGVISVGLGVPVILALSGVVYVLVIRRQRLNGGQRRFTDEEESTTGLESAGGTPLVSFRAV